MKDTMDDCQYVGLLNADQQRIVIEYLLNGRNAAGITYVLPNFPDNMFGSQENAATNEVAHFIEHLRNLLLNDAGLKR